jgi:integrase
MSASELIEQANAPTAIAKEREAKRSYPKTHANYWKARLEHRTYTRDGKTCEVPEWSVRIHFGGNRKSFDLETGNKEEAAAKKARDIYLSLIAKGWSATLADLNPKAVQPIEITAGDATIGEFLTEVERTSSLKPKTFRRYSQCLRRVAAHICGVKTDESRYDYRTGGMLAWRKQVDVIPLSAITPAAVADWKIHYLRRATNDPRRKLEVNRAFNSWLRNTKSLFSAAIINKPNFRIKVPKFKMPDGQHGDFEKMGSMKFQAPAGITYEDLVMKARKELRADSPEAYKLFLLCMCAGLRRGEADVCLWSQLRPDDCSIQVEATEFIEPKHGSGGTVYVDPALMKELLSFRADGQEGFVVQSHLEWKATAYVRYRCEPHWRTLLDWLESNGIAARKKVHELRKLFGDAIVKREGIFAGSAQLRHSTIQMTANHYTDPRQRAALPVGRLLSDKTPRRSFKSGRKSQEHEDNGHSNGTAEGANTGLGRVKKLTFGRKLSQ